MGKEPACGDLKQAVLGTHDQGVVKREADGHVVVICHHSQEEVIQQGQCHEEVHLHEAPSVGDGVVLCLDVDQHLGDNGSGEASANKGLDGQE